MAGFRPTQHNKHTHISKSSENIIHQEIINYKQIKTTILNSFLLYTENIINIIHQESFHPNQVKTWHQYELKFAHYEIATVFNINSWEVMKFICTKLAFPIVFPQNKIKRNQLFKYFFEKTFCSSTQKILTVTNPRIPRFNLAWLTKKSNFANINNNFDGFPK